VPVFELTHTWGGVPTSIIKIYPDGKVHFHRNETDAVHNHPATKAEDRYAQMTSEQLNELVDVFLSLPFDASKKLERAKGSANVPWRVFIAYKDKFINITIQDIIFFHFLENSPVGWAGGFAHRLAFIWWAEKRCPPRLLLR
jgi:hypothetical protein